MLVHNQTKHRILFDHDRRTYKFDPYGPCEVPEQVFEHMKLQRFPVSLAPVPAPEKAAAIVEEGRDAARGDEVERLKNLLSKTETDAKGALEAATAAEKRREAAEAETAAQRKALLEQTERANRYEADLKATTDQLVETARKLEESEQAMTRMLESATDPKSAAGGQTKPPATPQSTAPKK